MIKTKHSINGKHMGWWATLASGTAVYVAYRAGNGWKALDKKLDAWRVGLSTLNDAKARGVEWIVLIHDAAKKRSYYATHIDDLFGHLSHTGAEDGFRQRLLPRSHWRVNPLIADGYIDRRMRIR